jgi:hypothetical protein
MMSGMGRIFHYVDSPTDSAVARDGPVSGDGPVPGSPAALRKEYADDREIRPMARASLESNGSDGEAMLSAGWDFRYRRSDEKEKNLFGQTDTRNHRNVVCAGIQYTLPLLLVIDWRVDMKGNLRLQLDREDVPVTSRLRFTFMVNTDKEYMAGLRYILTKYIGLSTHYDSDMGYGAGVTLNY